MKNLSESLNGLIHKKVEKIVQLPNYVNIKFAGGGDLTIYNPVVMINPEGASIEIIENHSIKKIVEDEWRVEIYFDDESALSIDLKFSPVAGIEFMQLVMPGKPIVVWN